MFAKNLPLQLLYKCRYPGIFYTSRGRALPLFFAYLTAGVVTLVHPGNIADSVAFFGFFRLAAVCCFTILLIFILRNLSLSALKHNYGDVL